MGDALKGALTHRQAKHSYTEDKNKSKRFLKKKDLHIARTLRGIYGCCCYYCFIDFIYFNLFYLYIRKMLIMYLLPIRHFLFKYS